MKTASALFLVVLQTVASITAVSVTNGTTTSYDPAELLAKIFRPNVTTEARQRGYGLVKFENQSDPGNSDNFGNPGQYGDPGKYGLIDQDRDQRPLRFEDDYDQNYNTNIDNDSQYPTANKAIKFQYTKHELTSNNKVTFQDYNKVDDLSIKKKRKRRRRRKPKNGVLPYPGVGALPGSQGADGGRPRYPGYGEVGQAGYGFNPYGYPGVPGAQTLRRPRRPRPRPSLATEALSSITEALTSIARYDDYQCVPRLLCEAAGGGALASNGALQSIAGIQPLLTLLSAYNGLSSSPLFVFGRAVFLGMTSQGNTGTCRYAYPQCPTDPEQLIHYLNNHNGGFFRFFNAPQLPNQNVEQFYNQLGNQGYGIYQPLQSPQSYGFPSGLGPEQNYGLYPNNQYPNLGPNYENNDGIRRPGGYDRPNLYGNQFHGSNYAYDYINYASGNQIRFKDGDAKIQKRIQNKPFQNVPDYEIESFENYNTGTKWQFPEDQPTDYSKNYYNIRDSRTLKFPNNDQSLNDDNDDNRKGKQVYFPDKNNYNYNNNRQHIFSNTNRFETTTYSYNNGQYNQNYYTSIPVTYGNNNFYKPPAKYHNYSYNHNYNQKQQNYYNNKQNMYNNNQKYQQTTIFNNEEYVFDLQHNFYVKKDNNNSNSAYNTKNHYNNAYYTNNYSNNAYNFKRNEEDGLKTVYVIRGNGDPNKPEIVKLRPGQSVQ